MFDWVNLETLAVILAIAYLVLAMKESRLCWYCAFFSTAIYVWIFGDVSLYMESALNIYYMAMAVYGWYQWGYGGDNKEGVAVCRWTVGQHVQIIALVLLASFVSGYFLALSTDAKLPYLDSFTTWDWIVINTVSIFLFIDRELYQTAAMLTLYLALSVIGYFAWRKTYLEQNPNNPQTSPV